MSEIYWKHRFEQLQKLFLNFLNSFLKVIEETHIMGLHKLVEIGKLYKLKMGESLNE